MGFFSLPGRPSKNEEMIAEKVVIATRAAIRSQGIYGAALDEYIGEEIAKYTSDVSRTVFRKFKSMV